MPTQDSAWERLIEQNQSLLTRAIEKLTAVERERDQTRAALAIVADNEFVDTEIGMICIVCQRDPERLRTGVHEPDCWLDAALEDARS